MSTEKNKRIPAKKTHDAMVAEWMKDPAFKAEYNALEKDYALIKEMLAARKHSGLTQEEVAKQMGTKAPAVARLEAATARDKHSPSIGTLRKYASAVGCELEIHLKPIVKKRIRHG